MALGNGEFRLVLPEVEDESGLPEEQVRVG
jgi:hypothetical protein